MSKSPLRLAIVVHADGIAQPLTLRCPDKQIIVHPRIVATDMDYIVLHNDNKKVYMAHSIQSMANPFWEFKKCEKINKAALSILLRKKTWDVLSDDIDTYIPRGCIVFFKTENDRLVDYPKKEFEQDWPNYFKRCEPVKNAGPCSLQYDRELYKSWIKLHRKYGFNAYATLPVPTFYSLLSNIQT